MGDTLFYIATYVSFHYKSYFNWDNFLIGSSYRQKVGANFNINWTHMGLQIIRFVTPLENQD